MHSQNPEIARLIEEHGVYITYPQAAEITSVSVRTLKRETTAGNLPCYRIGRARALRLRTEDVANLVQRVA